ncbi:unnamed protein product [Moneuplotes crassus]|uniref:Uncharacterized protein n=1 Tax=Euplotes crassus TaxID=5936 RepID=A0AAD1XGU6_EUPCR|nr:unnamed protein product [Moneuplotes crassus]
MKGRTMSRTVPQRHLQALSIFRQESEQNVAKREIWDTSLDYFSENMSTKCVSFHEDQWNISLDLRIPDSSIIVKTFSLLGAKFNEVFFFFTTNENFKTSIRCLLDQDIKIKKLYLKFTDKNLSKSNLYCLIRNAHKISEFMLLNGLQFQTRHLSSLLHASRHISELVFTKCSLMDSCKCVKISSSVRVGINTLSLQYTKCSKAVMLGLLTSLAKNHNFAENLKLMYYKESIFSPKPGLTIKALTAILRDLGFKTEVKHTKSLLHK